jgi:O-methyltransferase involved in polyketide biosynthesis
MAPAQRVVFDAMANRVAAAGEPWHTFFDPAELIKDLQAMGFGHVEGVGGEEINERYFKDRPDGLRVGSMAHLMNARV